MTQPIDSSRLYAIAAAVLAALIADPTFAQIDYSASLADDFAADYADTGSGPQPQNNPFGDWTFLAMDGTTSSLVSVPSGLPASGQAGWGTVPSQGGPWTYFAGVTAWQPGVTIVPSLTGHAPQEVIWTVPAAVNEGGISIRGSLEQLFEPTRVLRLAVFKNGSSTETAHVDSVPPIVNGVILNRVDFGPWDIPVSPGDTLKFRLDGSGDGGTGVVTFGAWNVVMTEIAMTVPEPATCGLLAFGVAAAGALRIRRRKR